jgi:hypothetical protein
MDSDRVYISRDVVFDESKFPFSNSGHPQTSPPDHSSVILDTDHMHLFPANPLVTAVSDAEDPRAAATQSTLGSTPTSTDDARTLSPRSPPHPAADTAAQDVAASPSEFFAGSPRDLAAPALSHAHRHLMRNHLLPHQMLLLTDMVLVSAIESQSPKFAQMTL